MTPAKRANLVKRKARELGFESVGITTLAPVPHGESLKRWLETGMAGSMGYMHRQAARRLEPSRIVDGATHAVVVTRNYLSPDLNQPRGTGRVAKYARGRDYHIALQKPLDLLASFIRALGPDETIAKHFVDSGPVPERELAQRAGIGWIGKNTMLIDPEHGSYSFLATVLTNLQWEHDLPFEADRCGSCRRCLDACPTAAFPEGRVLDGNRCISYLTSEHKGEVSDELAVLTKDWIFGCDICQDVCPWNQKFASPANDPELQVDPSLGFIDLESLMEISEQEFERRYGWTPLERPGVQGMRRNARIAFENVG